MTTLPTLESRKTIHVNEDNDSGGHDISVISYNILADFYLQSALQKGRHKYCPKEYVTPKEDRNCPRHKLLMREVRNKM